MLLRTDRYPTIVLIQVALLFAFTGCDGRPTLVPISGKITIDGKPLETGAIQVYQKGYRAASAKIESDGSFKLQTFKNNDGCIFGEHPIAVFSNKTINDRSSLYYIPERYSSVETSDAKITVDRATDNLQINLTWSGTPHTAPYVKKE